MQLKWQYTKRFEHVINDIKQPILWRQKIFYPCVFEQVLWIYHFPGTFDVLQPATFAEESSLMETCLIGLVVCISTTGLTVFKNAFVL
jgi:hypothetical protein